ncbi:MAG: hypothetical protein ACI8WB_002512 [Phenylobacterium sp.]|jgi:hypothetical protein
MNKVIFFRCFGILLAIFIGSFCQFYFFADEQNGSWDVLFKYPALWFVYIIVGFGITEYLYHWVAKER